MKYIAILFFIFISIDIHSQSSEVPDIMEAILLASANETAALTSMAKNQEEVYKKTKDIVAKTATIIVLKNKYLTSLSKVNPFIEESMLYLQIGKTAQDIYDFQEQTLEYTLDKPELLAYAIKKELDLLQDSLLLLDDLRLALKEDDLNLLDDIDRMDIIEIVLGKLLKLRQQAKIVLANVKAGSLLDSLDTFNGYANLDFTAVYDAMEVRYLEIFPENLRED